MPAEILGLDVLERKLRQVVTESEKGADEALGRGAKAIEELARTRAPKRTGELAESLDHERDKPGVWFAGTNLWRAHFAEFGTRNHAAQPYLFPSFEQLRTAIWADMVASRVRGGLRGLGI